MQERRRSQSAIQTWTSCRVQVSFHAPSVALEWAAIASSATVASTGYTRNAEGAVPWQRTLTTDVHGVRELHAPGRQTTEGSPSQTWQVGDGSFLLLPVGDILSAAGGCELSTTTHVKMAWKKFKELLPVLSSCHLSFKTYGVCTALVCRAQCSMPVRLGHWQNRTSNVAAEWQGNDQTELQCQATRRPMNYLRDLALRIWTSFCRREGSAGMNKWNAPMVQSRQPFTYRLRESVGLGGPRWHGSSWQRGIAESGSSLLSTFMTEICGDLVWDLPCMQQASNLKGGPLMWMLPLYLHVNQKSDYDMMMMKKTYHLSENLEWNDAWWLEVLSCPQVGLIIYSRLSLSRIPRDSLKYFEISVVRHIRFAELRKK